MTTSKLDSRMLNVFLGLYMRAATFDKSLVPHAKAIRSKSPAIRRMRNKVIKNPNPHMYVIEVYESIRVELGIDNENTSTTK